MVFTVLEPAMACAEAGLGPSPLRGPLPTPHQRQAGAGQIGRGSVMAMKARGRPRQKDPPKQLAGTRASDHEVERWRKAWNHPASRLYLGWIDPFPMPPGTPCKPCLGGIRFWIEVESPHRDWRCVTCHPAPAGVTTRIYEIDEAAEAAERQRIEDAAKPPPPQPKPAVTTTDNWWE